MNTAPLIIITCIFFISCNNARKSRDHGGGREGIS
jgi:hypothetical protein